ncbi:DUF72 domain-containing protein [bacterium]|nr:DUF72 domain-containing protein [bacterium]
MEQDKNWRREEFIDEEEFFRENSDKEGASVFVGTSGWSYKDWEGNFYPAGTKQAGYLESYTGVFGVVEIDSTFYAVPRQSAVDGWAKRSSENFRFCAKFPREITHDRSLLGCGELSRVFLDRMSVLEGKLGPFLLQFPATFTAAENFPILEAYLGTLPGDHHYAVELRSRDWRQRETLELLAAHNVAWTIGVGAAGEEHRPLTADFAYIRWLGSREISQFSEVQVNRQREIRDWADWIMERAAELREVYGFFNNHYSGHAPTNARELLERLGHEPPPDPGRRQGSLFD